MTFPRSNADQSRTGSSRATSTTREILKKRDKPYKTEKKKMFEKKKKLDVHTSYKSAPAGYTFLGVGTPDLAERCKELSRLRGFPVNIVNSKPPNKFAVDPLKISHHIQRIGYHFKSEIVDDARDELGYIYQSGLFVKEAELRALNNQNRLAQIMARHGVRTNAPRLQETSSHVRDAIKELFPKIPQEDLEAIVHHAWQVGSHRVGTNPTLDLSHRVQLATIARIRHNHTDYDGLLKAFGDWKYARKEVEPGCLRKILEWRGELGDGDDNELEEIVRDIIVLDDDEDEDGNYGDDADDEDSVVELSDSSDSSVEITYHRADEDLGAESTNVTRHTHYYPQLSHRQLEEHNITARQKIEDVRRKMRTQGEVPNIGLPHQGERQFMGRRQPMATDMPTYQSREAPETITVEGQMYRRVPQQVAAPRPSPHPSLLHQPNQPSRGDYTAIQDRPLPSIEADTTYVQHHPLYAPPPQKAPVIDLTTPEPQPRYHAPHYGSPRNIQQIVGHIQPNVYYDNGAPAPAYRPDPRQPALGVQQYAYHYPVPQPVHGAPAPVQMVLQPQQPPPPRDGAPHPAQPYRQR